MGRRKKVVEAGHRAVMFFVEYESLLVSKIQVLFVRKQTDSAIVGWGNRVITVESHGDSCEFLKKICSLRQVKFGQVRSVGYRVIAPQKNRLAGLPKCLDNGSAFQVHDGYAKMIFGSPNSCDQVLLV